MESGNWEKTIIKEVLLETIKEQKSSRRWRIFFRFIWLIIILGIIYAILSNNKDLPVSGKHVAVVDLTGIINSENKTYDTVSEGLNDALKDKDTVAVIIKANSPGGSPTYSDMLYNEILRLRKLYPNKPIDVVVEEVCASGCYYIASAANNIYASPASIVGSIGVIYTGFGLTGLMQKAGVDSRLLISGKNKAMGYPFIPANKEQEAMQQQILDEIHMQFIAAVKNGRGKKLDLKNPDLFSGRYWIGQDGLKLGLIDGYATVDTLSRTKFKTENIVDYTPEQDPLEKIAKKVGVGLVDSAKQEINNPEFGSFK